MKVKIYLAILLMTWSISGALAQWEDFDISSYLRPVLDRQTLVPRIQLDGSSYHFPTRFRNGQRSTVNRFALFLSTDYTKFHNSEQFQKSSALNFTFRPIQEKIWENKNLKSKSNVFDASFSYDQILRKYRAGDRFVEIAPKVNLNSLLRNTFDQSTIAAVTTNTEESFVKHKIRIGADLKMGYGRIERVEDAWHANFILNQLSKVGAVAEDIPQEKIIAFAHLISKLKNERFFDSRINRMSNIQLLNEFLNKNNLIRESGVAYFSTLADFWSFGFVPERNSGSRLSFVLSPSYSLDYRNGDVLIDNVDAEDEVLVNVYELGAGIEYVREKAINMLWQNSFSGRVFFGFVEGRFDKAYEFSIDKYLAPKLDVSFSQSLGFYPNTRTEISTGIGLQYVEIFYNKQNEVKHASAEGRGLKTTIDLSFTYYVSPRFRINLFGNIAYIRQESDSDYPFSFESFDEGNFMINNFAPVLYDDYIPLHGIEFESFANLSISYSIF